MPDSAEATRRQPRRAPIRPLTAERLPEVADLYQQVARTGADRAPAGLVDYFRQMFLEPPNYDPETPSLIFEDKKGQVAGFLGVYARPLLFDGRPLRMACSGQLVVRPDARATAPGAFLLKQFLDGPQEVSITDGATTTVSRIWQQLGGHVGLGPTLGWSRWLRPIGLARDTLRAARPRLGPLLTLGAPLGWAGDPLLRKTFPRYLPPAPAPEGWSEEELCAASMAAAWPRIAAGYRLYPHYTETYLNWLLRETARVTQHGDFVGRLVRDAQGELRGWYLYYLAPGGVAETIQIAALPGAAEAIVARLLDDADRRGAVAVKGRLDSGLAETLRAQRCRIYYRAATFALFHAHEPALRDALHAGQALLTRADGEWWTGFLGPFD